MFVRLRTRKSWLVDRPAAEPLTKALSDDDGSIQEFAAGALGRIGDAKAVEPLTRALGDAVPAQEREQGEHRSKRSIDY